MIQILGNTKGSEYKAAEKLKTLFLDIWPDLGKSRDDRLVIFVGYMMHDARVKDIDLVVAGDFADNRTVQFPRRGGSQKTFKVKNFVIVVEVKGHDPRHVKFSGGNAFVKYSDSQDWGSATDQSRGQLHSFIMHLKSKQIDSLFVSNLIFFTQLEHSDLPDDGLGNFIASTTPIEKILYNAHTQFATYKDRQPDEITMAYASDDYCLNDLYKIMEEIHPTPLDRRRMDQIASAHWRRQWLDDIGKKQIIIRGRAGTGKTVALMQLADHAFRIHNKRSLLITYNLALVADLNRLKGLMGIPDGLTAGGISISTIHSLIGKLTRKMGISSNDFYNRFEDIKNEILDHVRQESVTQEDVEEYRRSSPRDFRFDVVFVDEGQDWPDNEIEILRWLFGLKNIVVADGVDQYVRTRTDPRPDNGNGWDRGLEPDAYVRRNLRKGVRMKNNLAVFMADVAWHVFKLDKWDVDPNDKAVGGRVLVLEGDLASRPDVYKELYAQARDEGNFPIDMLACVPPYMVDGSKECSVVGGNYRDAGIECWDACSDRVRKEVLPSKETVRIVQYQSSRGLEGWTVFLFRFDKFWDLKYQEGLKEGESLRDMFPEDYARRYAGQWMMIPMSRAIDTLVINLGHENSAIKNDLLRIHKKGEHDCIEWRKL